MGVTVLARFEDGDRVGTAVRRIKRGESYLGFRFEVWAEHSGEFVTVTDDGLEVVPATALPG